MNLIDRDELIEYLNETKKKSTKIYVEANGEEPTGSHKRWFDQFFELTKAIVEKQPVVYQWIPVEERLPKENGTYLATAKSINSSSTIEVMYYAKRQMWVDVVDDTILLNVIAWQPLPKPYEGE